MRTIEIHQGSLRLADRPVPVAAAGQVVIRVAAAGMNRADRLQVKGLYPPPAGVTDIPGLEVAGVVESLGPDVTHWHVGDRVCALLSGGGYADCALAESALCLPVPTGFDMLQAAALPETMLTVWNNVFVRGGLQAGQTLLVHGGTSGIGTMAIQMGVAAGARVLATTGSVEKAALCVELGATAINRADTDYVAAFAATPPNVVLDMAGGKTLTRDLELMAPDGRHVSIAYLENRMAEIDVALVMKKRLVITGSTLRGRPLAELAALVQSATETVTPWLESGVVKPVIDRVFALEDAAQALEYFASGLHIGKIVLKN